MQQCKERYGSLIHQEEKDKYTTYLFSRQDIGVMCNFSKPFSDNTRCETVIYIRENPDFSLDQIAGLLAENSLNGRRKWNRHGRKNFWLSDDGFFAVIVPATANHTFMFGPSGPDKASVEKIVESLPDVPSGNETVPPSASGTIGAVELTNCVSDGFAIKERTAFFFLYTLNALSGLKRVESIMVDYVDMNTRKVIATEKYHGETNQNGVSMFSITLPKEVNSNVKVSVKAAD